MSLQRHTHPMKGSKAAGSLRCSLAELYTSVEEFSKERRRSSLLQTRGLSVREARGLLARSLTAMTSGGPGPRGAAEAEPKVEAEAEAAAEAPSLADLLYRSLLAGTTGPAERMARSRQRLVACGIPPPTHTFPYDIIAPDAGSLSRLALWQRILGSNAFGRVALNYIIRDKLLLEDRIPTYFLADPEKQFMDLKDLEWRYFKGLSKWKHIPAPPFVAVKYDDEKRFVESRGMPGIIFPPLVFKSLVVYPEVNDQEQVHCSLKWDM